MKILEVLKSIFSNKKILDDSTVSSEAANEKANTSSSFRYPEEEAAVEQNQEVTAEREQADHTEWNQAVEYLQLGFFSFTLEKGTVGFFIDPENRWVKLASEVFSPEMEDIYLSRLLEMRDTTKGKKLAEKLERLKQEEDVSVYGEQLSLPNIDNAVLSAISDDTEKEGELSHAGRHPFPFRLVFGITIIQGILNLSDRMICKLVSESPYLQWFLGYKAFSSQNTIHSTNLVHFKKRLDVATMEKLNDIIIKNKKYQRELQETLNGSQKGTADECSKAANTVPKENMLESHTLNTETDAEKQPDGISNKGTLIMDATCGPVNIRFPQDFSLLNEARMDLEYIINRLCRDYSIKKPRTYVEKLNIEFLKLAKAKKKPDSLIHHVKELELNGIKRNLGYIENFLACNNVELQIDEIEKIQIIRAVYAQQKYMHDNKIKRVSNRIVSISLPFIRPISRGKTNKPYEFGPKYDIEVDTDGFVRTIDFSYDSFNESTHFIDVIEKYKKRNGYYPERVLVDQIYRTRKNRDFCKQNGIRISGPSLGRKPKDETLLDELFQTRTDDMVDRIEVERRFSREKRCFGIECIVEKAIENIGHAVGMSVFLDNAVPTGF